MRRKKIPIGISDFKKLIDGGYTYVDKTLLIEELVEKETEVALIPRPRRFGKTLNLSMLRYFFEKNKHDRSYLFKSLKIWQNSKCRALQGHFPVIFISLKDVKHRSWKQTKTSLIRLISRAFRAHPYLRDSSILDEEEKKDYEAIANKKGDESLYEESLFLLTDWLYRYHKKRVVLLIDEYDTPAHAAYLGGYYDELISFLRNWLSSGLKDNPALEKGVLTGILRIAKESIFSGLNNIGTFTILNDDFQDKFGLIESEVKELLKEYKLLHQFDDVRKWYNGYRIGSFDGIYNPWSVLSSIAKKGLLASYWVNTSDNALMKKLITQGSEELKTDIEELLQGGTVKKTIEEGLVFSDLEESADAIWSLLLFSGYLSLAAPSIPEMPTQLQIPNHEVKALYHSIILKWFKQTIRENKYNLALQSLTSGDVETFTEIFHKFFLSAFSYFDVPIDEPEAIYHSFVLGMLIGLKETYNVKSNRESGYGRYDVMLIPHNKDQLGIVIEFKKKSLSEKDLTETALAALNQIEARKYDLELKEQGIRRILHLGMAFAGKKMALQSKFL
jgi:predicted AAA-ATPase/PD-(D/E)XK nuclease superfamily protein